MPTWIFVKRTQERRSPEFIFFQTVCSSKTLTGSESMNPTFIFIFEDYRENLIFRNVFCVIVMIQSLLYS